MVEEIESFLQSVHTLSDDCPVSMTNRGVLAGSKWDGKSTGERK